MALPITTTSFSSSPVLLHPNSQIQQHQQFPFPFPFITKRPNFIHPSYDLIISSRHGNRLATITSATAAPKQPTTVANKRNSSERVFFDGGAHYGDLVTNLLLGFTLLWLPLTLAAVSRAFFLRYRFTNLRVTVVSGFTGQDRSDFDYKVIKDVQVVPRFIGEWGDIVITLKDGTKVDLRSVPKFREIADYCLFMVKESENKNTSQGVQKGRSSAPKGF